jgi:hypothetical protein
VYKLRNSSLCNFLHPPVNSSLIGQNIFLGILSNTVSLCLVPQYDRPNFTTV